MATVNIVSLQWAHIQRMKLEGTLEGPTIERITKEHIATLGQHAYAALGENDKILFCGGIIEYWKGRGEVWVAFSYKITPREFLLAHRAIRRILDVSDCKRLEASIACSSERSHRFIASLGFEIEVEHREFYSVDGSCMALYSLIRGDA